MTEEDIRRGNAGEKGSRILGKREGLNKPQDGDEKAPLRSGVRCVAVGDTEWTGN